MRRADVAPVALSVTSPSTAAKTDAALEVEDAICASVGRGAPLVLAVSGGPDSMALLAASARVVRDRIAAVATFDHGTGEIARRGTDLANREAGRLGIACHVGRAEGAIPAREAEWRAARWTFLRRVATMYGARIATAHTRDDQLETVVIRLLRGAGARGLAGLYADTGVVRPLVDVPRAVVLEYGQRMRVPSVADPSNRSRGHLRNRVRLDLLPALRRVRPTIDHELLLAARSAADWRASFERLVDEAHPVRRGSDGALTSVAAADLARYDGPTLAVIWPVLAARAGVTLDRRGTCRLAQFTTHGRVGGVIQLSGGVEVARTRFWFVFR
jgi:tRNA(Ile)-lysidine synthase